MNPRPSPPSHLSRVVRLSRASSASQEPRRAASARQVNARENLPNAPRTQTEPMSNSTDKEDVSQIDIPPLPPEKPSRARASGPKPLIPPSLRDAAVEELHATMKATRRYWDKASGAFVEEPDYATRQRAIELVLAYAEGRPVERKVNLTGDFSTYSEKLERMIATPEGLRLAIAAGLVDDPRKSLKTERGTVKIASVETLPAGGGKSQITQRPDFEVIDAS